MKRIILFLWAIALISVGIGCGEKTDVKEPLDGSGYETESPLDTLFESAEETARTEPGATAEETEGKGPETAEEETVWTEPDYPDRITTSGGAVIVGKLGRDQFGWFVLTEEPLDIELQSDGEVKEYIGVTEIALPESDRDGIDKSVYLGATVTVEGEMYQTAARGDVPGLSVCSIRVGKNTKKSHGVESVGVKEYVKYEGDSPEKMEVSIADGKYVYNPYILSKEALETLGPGFAEFYTEFIDTYINYGEKCSCPQAEYAKILSTVLFFEGAVFEADGLYDYATDYDPMEKIVRIRYKGSKEEHDSLIGQLTEKMNILLSKADPDSPKTERAKAVYNALTTTVTYDYDALERLDMNNPYYAFATGRGVCITFANAYLQLLTQVGIENTAVSGLMVNGEAHAWSLLRIDGLNYYCDPTFETSRDYGRGLVFFGMNEAKRTKDGTGTRGVSIGRYYPVMSDKVAFAKYSLK